MAEADPDPEAITPYRISIPDTKLHLLAQKLELAIFPDELDSTSANSTPANENAASTDTAWDYGAPLKDIKRLTEYWRSTYDWRKHEARINDQLPQFMTRIQVDGGFEALDVHFVHRRSEVEGAIPLLFSHGCMYFFLVIFFRSFFREGGGGWTFVGRKKNIGRLRGFEQDERKRKR